MILRVTQFGEPVLRSVGKPVEVFDDKLKELSQNMAETMDYNEGTGIAAPQVDLELNMFVIDVSWHPELENMPYTIDGAHPPLQLLMPMTMINTELETLPSETVCADEGCLSFPGIRGEVKRPERIRCTYQDLDGAKHTMEAGGWLARVIQHEYDHVKGVLFIDHMPTRELKMQEAKLKKIKRKSRDWLKVHGKKK